MKIFKLLSIFIILTTFAFAQTNRGVGVKVKDRNGKEREFKLYDASYALVIGNSNYKYWDVLNGVKSDVSAVEKALKENGFQVETATDLDSRSLSPRIEQFVKDHGYEEKNRLLIYFAGHGYTQKSVSDDRELGYIVPIDSPNPTKDRVGFLRTAVDLEEIRTFAKRIQSKHALFLFDSCFSGKLVSRGEIAVPPIIEESIAYPVRQFITAGAANQIVPDESIFRRAFIRGLEGEADLNKDGFILGSELASFLRDKVTNYSSRKQTPLYAKIDDINLDKGDFVFVSNKKSQITETSTPINSATKLKSGEESFWQSIENSNEIEDFENYFFKCENGEFACIYKASANLKLNRIRRIKANVAWKNFLPTANKLLQYDEIGQFSEGIAPIRSKNKIGFIDEKANPVTALIFDIDENNGENLSLFSFLNGYVAVQKNNKWGVIDRKGNQIIPFRYEDIEVSDYKLFKVKLAEKYGFLSDIGRVWIPLKYEEASLFKDGYAFVKLNNKWGLIDNGGNELTLFKYESFNEFKEGLALIKISNKWGYLNKSGKEIIQPKYDYAEDFHNGLAIVGRSDEQKNIKYGVIDQNGKEIIETKYNIIGHFFDSVATVELNKKWGFIDENGNQVIQIIYDDANWFSEGVAPVKKLDKWGFIDKSGREQIPFNFTSADSFSGGLARVSKLNRDGFSISGYINKEGEEVIPIKYNQIDPFENGIASMRHNMKYGLVNKSGKEIVPPKYEEIWLLYYFKQGFIGVTINGKKGFLDIYGNEYFDF